MKILTLLKRLIFVPTCASCKERLSPFPDKSVRTHEKICLCPKCYKEWLSAGAKLCDKCAKPAYKCSCIPRALEKDVTSIPSLCFYNPEENGVENKIIYSLKRTRNTELISYLAFELYPHIVDELDMRGISRESLVFSWIPRRKSAVAKYGFDQGELLAKNLAKLFGAKALPIFLRIGGKEQKKLDIEQRRGNLEKSVVLNHNLIGFSLKETKNDLNLVLENKNVVIIDDVITTGASMKRGIELLKSVYNGQTIVLSVAKTIK